MTAHQWGTEVIDQSRETLIAVLSITHQEGHARSLEAAVKRIRTRVHWSPNNPMGLVGKPTPHTDRERTAVRNYIAVERRCLERIKAYEKVNAGGKGKQ